MMMTAIKCPTPDKLKSLSLGRLMDEESDELMAHVNSCSSCQTEMETVDDVEDSLIASIRDSGAFAEYYAEPDCQVAMANALGALAKAGSSDRSDVSQTELPKQIGEYEIVRPLGRGGMGSVYLARHTKLGRQVALKILAHHRLGDQRVRNRFEVEMQAVGRLSHPNIVTAHDARDIAGTPVLVTEFIDGFDLGQMLQRTGSLSIADACEIVRQIANALEYTSGQGFVHRDVKPSNIMLSRSGDVKLLDLGLARIELGDPDRPEMTGTGQAMGTADYIAPEQVNDSRSVDVRADIYSLGCTLFKLLTGTAPFADENHPTAFAKMTAHVSTPAPRIAAMLRNVPSKLARLVDSMLAKAPSDRPNSPAEVARQLDSFAAGFDFEQLIEHADISTGKDPVDTDVPPTFAAQPLSMMKRMFPGRILVATGLAALLIGFALGVIVTITFPDGSTTTINGPDGTDVKVENDDDPGGKSDSALAPTDRDDGLAARREKLIRDRLLALQLTGEELLTRYGPDHPEVKRVTRQLDRFKKLYPDLPFLHKSRDEAADAPGESESTVVPLMFGVLVKDDHQLADELPKVVTDDKPIVMKTVTWFPVAEGLEVESVGYPNGNKYAAVANSENAVIRWEEIVGNMGAGAKPSRHRDIVDIDLNFHGELKEKMRRLSSENNNRELAIIFNGKIVAAPQIKATITERAQVSGNFSSEEIRYLIDGLNDGLLTPLRRSNDVDPNENRDRRRSEPDAEESSVAVAPYIAIEASPLMFGIAAKQLGNVSGLPNSPQGPVIYEGRRWFPADESISIPTSGSARAHYAPVERDRDAIIRWSEIVGHMGAKMKNGSGNGDPKIELDFDELLSAKMKHLTRAEHHGRELVIVLNGRIVAAPTIRATISNQAELTGSFSDEDILRLLNALNTGLLPKGEGHSETFNRPGGFSFRRLFKSKSTDRGVANLRQIGLGVINYESTFRRFPSSKMTEDNEGQSAQPHSWRVAILPFIERQDLYDRYRFDEPWDSEHNRQLLAEMPDVYRSPLAPDDQNPDETNYIGFVGRQSVFAKTEGIRVDQVRDGTSKTLMVVESKLTIPWTKPDDFHFEKSTDAEKASPFDGQPLRVIMTDGSTRELKPENHDELFKMITRSGGEAYELEAIAPLIPSN